MQPWYFEITPLFFTDYFSKDFFPKMFNFLFQIHRVFDFPKPLDLPPDPPLPEDQLEPPPESPDQLDVDPVDPSSDDPRVLDFPNPPDKVMFRGVGADAAAALLELLLLLALLMIVVVVVVVVSGLRWNGNGIQRHVVQKSKSE